MDKIEQPNQRAQPHIDHIGSYPLTTPFNLPNSVSLTTSTTSLAKSSQTISQQQAVRDGHMVHKRDGDKKILSTLFLWRVHPKYVDN